MARTRVATAFEAWKEAQSSETPGYRRLAEKILQRFFIIASREERSRLKSMIAEIQNISKKKA